jgi:hypothetical protein
MEKMKPKVSVLIFMAVLVFSLLIGCSVPLHPPFLEGDHKGYFLQAYFPKDVLNDILPDNLTIPDNATMAKYYPDTKLLEGAHPFIIAPSHGKNIHDLITRLSVPEQEEITFLFPVIYTHDDGNEYLCTYVPLLYLDSPLGVQGGLFFGLRKEYHPEMEYGEPTTTSKWWSIGDIFEVSFVQTCEVMEELPNFFKQTMANPNVTYSYPLPVSEMVFYKIRVYPNTVREASETFYWNYKGATVRHSEDTWSVYSDYYYTISLPMNGKQYFKCEIGTDE